MDSGEELLIVDFLFDELKEHLSRIKLLSFLSSKFEAFLDEANKLF